MAFDLTKPIINWGSDSSDDDNDETEGLLDQICKLDKEESKGATPEVCKELFDFKSSGTYFQWVDRLRAWSVKNDCNFEAITVNNLLQFFKDQSCDYAPTTLWQGYSCLNRYFSVYKGWTNFRNYPMLKMLLKKFDKQHQKKKAAVLTTDQINKWLDEAPEENGGIMHKAAFVQGYFGTLRVDEIVQLGFEHVNTASNEFIRTTLTGSVSQKSDQAGNTPFTFLMTRNEQFPKRCPFRITQAYIAQVKDKEGRFFRNWNVRMKGFGKQPAGKNCIAKIPFKIAEFLQLENPELYTGHCFRRSSATALADSGMSKLNFKRQGRWKSDAAAEGYISNGKHFKLSVSQTLNTALSDSQHSAPATAMAGTNAANSKVVYIQNCQNVAIQL